MRMLSNMNDTLLDFVENSRVGARVFHTARLAMFGLIIVVGSRFIASQFLAFDFRDVLFMAVTAMAFLMVYWRREIGIVLIVGTTAFITHYGAIPTVSLYHFVPELRWLEPWRLLLGQAIMLLMFGLFFTSNEVRTLKSRVSTPLAGAIAIFLLAIVAAATAGVVFGDVYFPQMVALARHYSFYLAFFAVLLCLNSRRSLQNLLLALLGMAVIMGILMVAQFVLGPSVRLFIGESVRVETIGRFAGRVLPPGQALVWFGVPMLIAVTPTQHGRNRVWLMLALGIVVMGLLLTFTRAMWMGALGAVLLMVAVVGGSERQRIVRMFAIFVGCVVFVLLILGTISTDQENYVASYMQRFTSTFRVESYEEGSTIGERMEEMQEAWPRVMEKPWLGIGIGGTYSHIPKWDDAQQSHVWRPRTYIHNVYMLILTKAGAVGLATFLIMIGTFFWRARWIVRRLHDPVDRAITVGAMGATFACVIGSILQPSLARAGPVSLIAILWGVVELLRYFEQRRVAPSVASRTRVGSTHVAPGA